MELKTIYGDEPTENRNQADGCYQPDDLCPGCGDSVVHPLYKDCYANDVRCSGQPLTGWHNDCAETEEAAKAETLQAILAYIPTIGGVQ